MQEPVSDVLFSGVVYDRATAIESVHRLFWAIDAKLWPILVSSLNDEVDVRWPQLWGGLDERCTSSSLVEALSRQVGSAVTLHQCTNPLVTFERGRAEARVLVTARWRRSTLRGSENCTLYGELHVGLVHHQSGWRTRSMHYTPRWTEGNPAILAASTIDSPASVRPKPSFPPDEESRTAAERIRHLEDRAAIQDLMMRFGRALDSKDWELYRSCFVDRVTLDFSETTGQPARQVDTATFVEFAKRRQRLHASFHQYSNFQVRISGDTARCLLYLVARHRISETDYGDPLNVFVGWYDNEFLRLAGEWKISILRHPLQWVEGNALIKDAPDPAVEQLAHRLFGSPESV